MNTPKCTLPLKPANDLILCELVKKHTGNIVRPDGTKVSDDDCDCVVMWHGPDVTEQDRERYPVGTMILGTSPARVDVAGRKWLLINATGIYATFKSNLRIEG